MVAYIAVQTAADAQSSSLRVSQVSLTLRVTPSESLVDVPLSIEVKGAAPGARVNLAVSSVDAKGVTWSSRSTFVAASNGTVRPATLRSIAGSYTGHDSMGPVDSMKPDASGDDLYSWGTQPQAFVFSATDGSHSTTAAVTRRGLAPGVRAVDETIAAKGFFGEFWIPPHVAHHSAVLEFGGSEGGLDGQGLGALLASHGYPTLDIAYFGEPGLPSSLSDISLNYFAAALRWLRAQPQVDASKIFVAGASRGSEAALLLGAYFPSLVHGVIASTPSNVALCSYPGCQGPAWTLNGKPLPYTTDVDVTEPLDNPAAVIPVTKIRGPILLDCGGADLVWDSCSYADAIMSELSKSKESWVHQLFSYPDAGHGVNGLVPYEPGVPATMLTGVFPLSNQLADANLWPRVLTFLASQG